MGYILILEYKRLKISNVSFPSQIKKYIIDLYELIHDNYIFTHCKFFLLAVPTTPSNPHMRAEI